MTLIECLMGILLLTSILIGIAPPLAIVVATRVQNRRAEQAQQLAQAEIDRIRVLVAQSGYTKADLPGVETGAPETVNMTIRNQLSSPVSCSGKTPEDNQNLRPTELVKVDVDGNCETDFLVQSVRTQGQSINSNRPPGRFTMTVRVYAALGREQGGLTLNTKQAALKLAGGQGSQNTNPLAVVQTEIFALDSDNTGCILNSSLCVE
ncbi:hypothetical protein NG799_26775 [Laspinema sp. D1]|uniref:Type II secretion system protein n=1 Tax=Laspinema palackyanum D2a TaxID=2953684 RepID=A0ABT2MYT2_9CYAN|nr:hypothetical protein [Laspinema sp. D2a]